MQKWIFAALGLAFGIILSGGAYYVRHHSEVGRYGTLYEGVVEQDAIRCRQFHNAIVFIGDSNTVSLATSNIVPNSENLGVNGDTVDRILYRIQPCDLHGANTVVLAAGTNDWAENRYTGFRNRYGQLLHAIPPNVRIIASAIPPVNEQKLSNVYDTRGMIAGIAKANETIKDLCKSDSRCTFFPVPPELYAGSYLAPSYDSGIGVHLNASGQQVWARALSSLIK